MYRGCFWWLNSATEAAVDFLIQQDDYPWHPAAHLHLIPARDLQPSVLGGVDDGYSLCAAKPQLPAVQSMLNAGAAEDAPQSETCCYSKRQP